MATSKILQTPKIIGITAGTIRVAHPNISKYTKTYLASPIAASGTAVSVYDNNNINDDDQLLFGQIGDSKTETVDVNGAVTRGQSLTVTNTLKLNHELDCLVTRIQETKVAIYGSTTDGGTLVAIKEGVNAIAIQWNRDYTEYMLTTSDTAYAYYAVKFYDGTTYSSASDYVASTGITSASVQYMIEQACDLTNYDMGANDESWLVRCANDAQSFITQYELTNIRSGVSKNVDWDFEITSDTSTTIVENQIDYDLSSLYLKYPNTKASISVRLGSTERLDKITTDEMDEELEDCPHTTTTVQALAADTTLTITTNVELDDSGSLYLGGELITYTGKSSTTGLTGIPASGTGAITETHAVGSHVWQNIVPGTPDKYTILNKTLTLNIPPDSDLASYPINLKFYKKLTALTSLSDTTEVTFSNAFQYFIASRIEMKRQNPQMAKYYKDIFEDIVRQNASKRDTILPNVKKYYKYSV